MHVRFSDFKIIPVLDSIKRLDIDDKDYFGSKYKDYISNSRLKFIDPKDDGSPSLYKCPPHFTTSSLNIGSSVHELLLQPDSFALAPKMHKPTAKLGEVADYVYNHRKDDIPIEYTIREASRYVGYYVNQIDSKIPMIIEKCQPYWDALDLPRWKKNGVEEIFLSDSDHVVVSTCLESCYNNREIMDKLHPTDVFGDPIESYNEIAFFIDFLVTYKGKKCTTLKFKMKADNYTVDVENKKVVLNDLKTTGKPVRWFMNAEYGSIIHFSYYRQLALYLWVLTLYCSQKYGASKDAGWTSECNFLVVQTTPDYESRCYNMSSYWLKKGKREAEELLKRVAAQEIFGWDTEINFE